MGFEIDFFAVGDESQSGDAIGIRYGNLHGGRSEQVVALIDGGFKETGERIVDHVRSYYDANGYIDYVVSTHPDQDHVSGLSVVLEELQVGRLYMHSPAHHSMAALSAIREGVLSTNATVKRVVSSLQRADDLISLAQSKRIPVIEPFAGVTSPDGALRFLGPSQSYYEELMGSIIEEASSRGLARQLAAFAKGAITEARRKFKETFHLESETLDDLGETSPSNNSSAIALLAHEEKRLLFTGDAGIPALEQALDYAELSMVNIKDLHLFQVPHHGSKRNLGPKILDRLGTDRAYISAATKGHPKHPSPQVTNALHRRDTPTYATRGLNIRHHFNAPDRLNWNAPVDRVPFCYEWEEETD